VRKAGCNAKTKDGGGRKMKYIVSARTKCPVAFDLVELEAENEDELKDKIFDTLVESLCEADLVIQKEVLGK
jgi:hypothetical protein